MSGDAHARLPRGTRIERFEIVRFMANGGFGDVYEARDTRLDRRVVVKSLRAEAADDPDTRARFLREGSIAAQIVHPNVVQVFDVIERPEGDAFLVMELLEGNDLGAELSARGPLPTPWLCDVVLPVCAAVAQVHARGVLHRDIKPGNIFLSRSPDGEVIPKLLDFGISRPLDQQTGELRTRTGTVLGSPRYMAPEQLEARRDVDGRADVYALGAVLYRCLTGAMPYQHPGDTAQVELFTLIARITHRELVPPRQWRPDLDPALEAAVLRAMAHDRAARFADARELGAALVPFASAAGRARWEPVLARASLPSAPVAHPHRNDPTINLDPTTTSASVSSVVSPPPLPATARRTVAPWIAAAAGIVLVAVAAGLGVRASRSASAPPPAPPVQPPTALLAGSPLTAPATPPVVAPVPPPTLAAPIAGPTAAPTVEPSAEPAAPVAQDERPADRRRHRHVRALGNRAAPPTRPAGGTAPPPTSAAPTTRAHEPSPPRSPRCANGADCDL